MTHEHLSPQESGYLVNLKYRLNMGVRSEAQHVEDSKLLMPLGFGIVVQKLPAIVFIPDIAGKPLVDEFELWCTNFITLSERSRPYPHASVISDLTAKADMFVGEKVVPHNEYSAYVVEDIEQNIGLVVCHPHAERFVVSSGVDVHAVQRLDMLRRFKARYKLSGVFGEVQSGDPRMRLIQGNYDVNRRYFTIL